MSDEPDSSEACVLRKPGEPHDLRTTRGVPGHGLGLSGQADTDLHLF